MKELIAIKRSLAIQPSRLHGFISHHGPILAIANWSGTWPGLVGLLNLNGSLTKAGVKYGTLWSESFDDDYFRSGIKRWLEKGKIKHDSSHVHSSTRSIQVRFVALARKCTRS